MTKIRHILKKVDTFIYTFIAIYKSLKIIRNTVLFSLLPYSVPFKIIAKIAFAILYEKMTS